MEYWCHAFEVLKKVLWSVLSSFGHIETKWSSRKFKILMFIKISENVTHHQQVVCDCKWIKIIDLKGKWMNDHVRNLNRGCCDVDYKILMSVGFWIWDSYCWHHIFYFYFFVMKFRVNKSEILPSHFVLPLIQSMHWFPTFLHGLSNLIKLTKIINGLRNYFLCGIVSLWILPNSFISNGKLFLIVLIGKHF